MPHSSTPDRLIERLVHVEYVTRTAAHRKFLTLTASTLVLTLVAGGIAWWSAGAPINGKLLSADINSDIYITNQINSLSGQALDNECKNLSNSSYRTNNNTAYLNALTKKCAARPTQTKGINIFGASNATDIGNNAAGLTTGIFSDNQPQAVLAGNGITQKASGLFGGIDGATTSSAIGAGLGLATSAGTKLLNANSQNSLGSKTTNGVSNSLGNIGSGVFSGGLGNVALDAGVGAVAGKLIGGDKNSAIKGAAIGAAVNVGAKLLGGNSGALGGLMDTAKSFLGVGAKNPNPQADAISGAWDSVRDPPLGNTINVITAQAVTYTKDTPLTATSPDTVMAALSPNQLMAETGSNQLTGLLGSIGGSFGESFGFSGIADSLGLGSIGSALGGIAGGAMNGAIAGSVGSLLSGGSLTDGLKSGALGGAAISGAGLATNLIGNSSVGQSLSSGTTSLLGQTGAGILGNAVQGATAGGLASLVGGGSVTKGLGNGALVGGAVGALSTLTGSTSTQGTGVFGTIANGALGGAAATGIGSVGMGGSAAGGIKTGGIGGAAAGVAGAIFGNSSSGTTKTAQSKSAFTPVFDNYSCSDTDRATMQTLLANYEQQLIKGFDNARGNTAAQQNIQATYAAAEQKYNDKINRCDTDTSLSANSSNTETDAGFDAPECAAYVQATRENQDALAAYGNAHSQKERDDILEVLEKTAKQLDISEASCPAAVNATRKLMDAIQQYENTKKS